MMYCEIMLSNLVCAALFYLRIYNVCQVLALVFLFIVYSENHIFFITGFSEKSKNI